MIHTADLAALHTHLDAHPADWSARLVLADLLLDLGDEKGAACQRWMCLHRKHPRHQHDINWLPWHWWHELALSNGPHRLSAGVTRHIPKTFMEWPTRQSAEAALLTALVAAGEI